MFCKKLILFLLLTTSLVKSEGKFKKSLHYYFGLCRFIHQTQTTHIQINKINDGEKIDKDQQKEVIEEEAQCKKDTLLNSQLHIFFDTEATKPSQVILKDAIIKAKDRMIINQGAIFSLYLGEFLDIFSFGLCVSNENQTEDSISFNPSTERMENYVKNNNEASNNNDHTSKKNSKNNLQNNFKGILFLNRYSPIMIGGFCQVQNDDIDSYYIGAKLSFMIGYLQTYGVSKELQTFCNEELLNNNKILLKTSISLNITFAILFKFEDIEISILCGFSWAPMGINFKQKGICNENHNHDNHEDFSELEVNSNHLKGFVGLSFGFSFD